MVRAVCAHCGAACPVDVMETPAFCCSGCRSAHALINGCGLGGFYRLAERPGLAPRPMGRESWQDLVVMRNDGLAGITWHIGGMHCASCLWILERLPALCPGVRAATASFADDELRVVFDPVRTTADAAAAAVAALGYALHAPAARVAAARTGRRDLLARFAVSAGAAVATMHLSLNLYAGDLARDLDHGSRLGFGVAAGLAALPAALYGAAPFFRGAWGAARAGVVGIDAATALVVAVGMVASVAGLIWGGDLYFDAVAMYVALLLGGRLVMLETKERALRAIGVQDHLLPRRARVVSGGGERDIPRGELQVGDRVVVVEGSSVPCDGVAETPAVLEVAVMTGESRPVPVAPGGNVSAGAVCLSPRMELTATAVGDDTHLGRLLAAAAPRQDAGDGRWLGWMLAAQGVAAALVLVCWWHSGAAAALRQAVAVVMVSCPCALGLAAPLGRAFACARSGGVGILVRDGGMFSRLPRIRDAVFDKTGTLTAGRMRVVAWAWNEADGARRSDLARAVMAAEACARHPAAPAIAAAAAGEVSTGGDGSTIAAEPGSRPPEAWREIPGAGIAWRATIAGIPAALRLGSAAFTGVDGSDASADSVVHLAVDGRQAARIVLADPVRADAAALVAAARAQGWRIHVFSGDGPGATAAAAAAAGADDARGGLLPADKARAVAALGPCLVIGDGVNDAAAMTAAEIAIGVRGGLAAAVESCDAVFVGTADRDRAGALAALVAIAAAERRARRRLVAFTCAYNILAVALVADGAIGPWICAVAMPASSLVALAIAACTVRRVAPASAVGADLPPNAGVVIAPVSAQMPAPMSAAIGVGK